MLYNCEPRMIDFNYAVAVRNIGIRLEIIQYKLSK